MRVLHVCNHFHPCIGGVERYVFDLSKELIKKGHISDVACLDTCSHSEEKLPATDTIDGIKIYRMPYTNLKYYKIAPSIMTFINNYDIIHIHGIGFFSDFLSITKWRHKKPLVLSTHGGIFHTKKISCIKNIYFSTLQRFSLRNMDKIIATGVSDLETFSKISDNVTLIEPGIDYKKFAFIKHNPKKNTFLFVGRISKNKRVDNLIRVISGLKKDVPDIRLYIAGDDWEGLVDQLQLLSKELKTEKNIIFTGRISDAELKKYYSMSQFFISASEYEGFGISVAEAMAAGCVPVLNDIPAFRSIVTDGVSGILTDFKNPDAAAGKIRSLMATNTKEMQKNAAKSDQKYDWEDKAGEIESIYLACRRIKE